MPLVPAELGQEWWQGATWGESGDRQTDVGPGVGREVVGVMLAQLEVAEELCWGREGAGAGWSWDVR